MKMELIVALLHNPQILFLDEPTIGLDAIASKQIRKFLKQINEERGTTILLTSHYMEDIKKLCQRTVVVNRGKKIFDGNTEELFGKYQRNKVITVTFADATNISLKKEEGIMTLENSPFKKVYECHKDKVKFLLRELMQYEPVDVGVEEEEIGIVVERIYQEEKNV